MHSLLRERNIVIKLINFHKINLNHNKSNKYLKGLNLNRILFIRLSSKIVQLLKLKKIFSEQTFLVKAFKIVKFKYNILEIYKSLQSNRKVYRKLIKLNQKY